MILFETTSHFFESDSDYCVPLKLTNRHSVYLTDVTPSVEDANSKLVDVVSAADADIDDEERVANSLLQISKLKFGHKAQLLFRIWALRSRF